MQFGPARRQALSQSFLISVQDSASIMSISGRFIAQDFASIISVFRDTVQTQAPSAPSRKGISRQILALVISVEAQLRFPDNTNALNNIKILFANTFFFLLIVNSFLSSFVDLSCFDFELFKLLTLSIGVESDIN